MRRSRPTVAHLALVLAATLTWTVAACSQHPMGSHQVQMPAIAFPGDSAFVEIPFEVDRNHIVIPIRLEGSAPVRGILDTGARGTVIFGDSLVNALGMSPAGRAMIKGVGGTGTPAHGSVYSGVHIGIGGLSLSRAMLVAMPDSTMRDSPLRGRLAIGRGLFEQAVVEIDWDAGRLRIHDPARFHYEGSGKVVPLTFETSGQPHLTASVAIAGDSSFEVNLILDTGASHALSLEPGADPRIHVPAGAPRVRVGRGTGGHVWGAIGTATSVEIGGITLRNVPVTYPDSSLGLERTDGRQGSLGSAYLNRFRVILDYPNRRMILVPGPHVADPIVLPPY